MGKYFYEGPVLLFDKLVAEHWKGETIAPSESKARTNLAYQYKKNNNFFAAALESRRKMWYTVCKMVF